MLSIISLENGNYGVHHLWLYVCILYISVPVAISWPPRQPVLGICLSASSIIPLVKTNCPESCSASACYYLSGTEGIIRDDRSTHGRAPGPAECNLIKARYNTIYCQVILSRTPASSVSAICRKNTMIPGMICPILLQLISAKKSLPVWIVVRQILSRHFVKRSSSATFNYIYGISIKTMPLSFWNAGS